MKYRIELVSAKPNMVVPTPIKNGILLPILEIDVPQLNTVSSIYTVMADGSIAAGEMRIPGWAYVFEIWCHNQAPTSAGIAASGSIINILHVETEYANTYSTYVLVNQLD